MSRFVMKRRDTKHPTAAISQLKIATAYFLRWQHELANIKTGQLRQMV